MSYQEAFALQQLFEQREQDINALVESLSFLRHEFKHQAVEPKAIELFFSSLIKGSFNPEVKVSQYSFACLCHLVKRIFFQDQPKLRRYANDVVPVLIEKLVDTNKVHDIARKALTDYWRATSLDVERCLRRSGFLNDSDRVRAETLGFLCSLQLLEPKFSPRTLLFDIVSSLRDTSEIVQRACKTCILDLYKTSPPQALADLKSAIESQDIKTDIAVEILKELGIYDEPTPTLAPAPAPTPVVEFGKMTTPDAQTNIAPTPQRRTPLAAVVSTIHDSNRILPTAVVNATAASTELAPTIELLVKKVPGTGLDDLKTYHVTSADDLESYMDSLATVFEGKESEFNWEQRQRNIVLLRELTRGNAVTEHIVVFITCLKGQVDGINKSASSLRTTLSAHGCKLIMDLAVMVGAAIDPFVDSFLQSLIKLSSSTKKIAAQNAHAAVVVLLAHTSFQSRIASLVAAACRDKNAQTRLYGCSWLQLLLAVHQNRKTVMEGFNCVELFEGSIKHCLTDANPKVRETIRPTFWEFVNIWPSRAPFIMKTLDPPARKALEKLNPNQDTKAPAKSEPVKRPSFRTFDRSALLNRS
ncbi:clasp N terminal-domain-containing protein [Lipomyces arxii]|uniref:clasp N terminal-domain-containing protein n=1 Tax=Lipomyces arxii TaxID=56418 RepID=UPI0034CE739B